MAEIRNSKSFTIGYALSPKKVQTFIQQTLIDHAKHRGIHLLQIDPSKPLIDQGPFDCIIHKLYGDDWNKQLQDYVSKNPNCVIIDDPASIERLHNRISMLQVVNEVKIPNCDLILEIPKQIVVYDRESLVNPNLMESIAFPMVAKPLVADGTANSHVMMLVFNCEGLKKIDNPIVLQEFVNHGGVVFKVYVAGDNVKCVKRRSLPDISMEKLSKLGDLILFSQISNLAAQNHNQASGESNDEELVEAAELPPLGFVVSIARELRRLMKLNLFNFDVIRDARDGNRYVAIDINYFPGYAKVPEFESMLTDFFLDVVNGRREDVNGGVGEEDEQVEGSACCSGGD